MRADSPKNLSGGEKRKRTRKKFRTVWLVRLFRILFHDRPGNPGTGYLLRVGSGPM